MVVSLCIATAPLGCKKKEGDAPESAVQGASEAGVSAPADRVKEDAVVASPIDPSRYTDEPVAYPMALEPLLDLVPAGEDAFVVVRDPRIALSLVETYVVRQTNLLSTVVGQADSEMGIAARKSLAMFDELNAKLDQGVIDTNKGMVFLPRGGTVIYGATDPQTLPRLLKELGFDEAPEHCVAVDGAQGYAVCTDDASVVAQVAIPGKQGATVRQSIGDRLPGVDLDRANIVAYIDMPTGPLATAVATTASQVHAAVALGDLAQPVGEAVAAATPKTLGLVAPGATFVWGHANMGSLKAQLASQGPPVSTVGGTLTGEVLFGGLESGALAMLAAVDDPSPASGLITMAAMQIEHLPKQLDDGTKLEVKVEKLEIAGKEAQILHAILSGSSQVAALDKLGFAPQAFAFSAGRFAGLLLGGDADNVKRTAEFAGDGLPAELLARLPTMLARSLAAGEAAWVAHLPLDGLQAPSISSLLGEALRQSAAESPMELEAEPMTAAALAALAPFSSISVWMTHPAKERVAHLVVDGAIEVGSEEGKAVSEAIAAIAGGADRAATYAALASSHPSSPRAARFAARAGDDSTAMSAAMTVAMVTGALAAIAIPAFTKYIELSRAAGELPPPE
jgi:hypothetical protein